MLNSCKVRVDIMIKMPTLKKASEIKQTKKTGQKNIVLFDVDFISRKELKMNLEAYGYNVTQDINDSSKFYTQCRAASPSVYIVNLSEWDADILMAVKMVADEKIAPIIVITNAISIDLVKILKAANIYAWLVKPVHLPEVVSAIENAIERFSSNKVNVNENILTATSKTDKTISRAVKMLSNSNDWTEEYSFEYLSELSKRENSEIKNVALKVLLNS